MSDSYIDPQTGVLYNKLGLTDQNALDETESDLVAVRDSWLNLNPIKGNLSPLLW